MRSVARRRDDVCVEGAVRHLPVGRLLAMDERGVGLRATWHLDRGFLNVSLWRDDTCVETFHLSPADAARLVGFIAEGLADASGAAVAGADIGGAATG